MSKPSSKPWRAVDLRHQQRGNIRIVADAAPFHTIANVLASGDNAAADARLIATAPEMLEMLALLTDALPAWLKLDAPLCVYEVLGDAQRLVERATGTVPPAAPVEPKERCFRCNQPLDDRAVQQVYTGRVFCTECCYTEHLRGEGFNV